jgi:hypothetical protein
MFLPFRIAKYRHRYCYKRSVEVITARLFHLSNWKDRKVLTLKKVTYQKLLALKHALLANTWEELIDKVYEKLKPST